jgi:hypothetical protein
MGESGECFNCGLDMWNWSFEKAKKHVDKCIEGLS